MASAQQEEKKVQFTKKNDEITINSDSGKEVSIKSLSDKSSDKLVFGAEYSQDKFAYEKSGNDLVIKYDEKGDNEQTITISGYFTKDGNSKSSLKTIKIGETEKSITELYKNEVKNGFKGTMFDDTITSSTTNDKMYGLGGNNTYIFNADLTTKFGDDTVYATGSKDTLKFAEGSKLTYTKKGNDIVISVTDKEGENATELGSVTIKDALKSKKNVSIITGSKEVDLDAALKETLTSSYDAETIKKGQTIKGTVLSDTITGSKFNDKIYTGAGNDTITAGKGNDTINITGAGNKTINISDFDGNDVITGIAKADKVTLNFTSVDKTVDYSKSGNNLVATREFYKKLDGSATTAAKSTENAKQMYVDKDGNLTTDVEGNTAITGELYKSTDGKYSTTMDATFTSQVYLDKDGKLTTDAQTGEVNNTAVNKLYEKDTNYTMSATYEHANDLVKETTTIKDYFKNSKNADKLDGVTNVAVSGKGKIVGGFTNDTITGSAKADKMYGMGGNNTYIFNTDLNTSFGNDTVYATGTKDTLTFAENSKLTYTLKGNDVIVSVAGSDKTDKNTLGTVTIKDALKSEKNVFIKVGTAEETGLEAALKAQGKLTFDVSEAKKGQTVKGTVFNDVITGSAKADKIYTGAGNDTITAGKGNDTINITGAGQKTINIANGDGNDVITGIAKAEKVTLSGLTEGKLSYAKSGNDLIITRIEKDAVAPTEKTAGTPAETATTTIKDYFKDAKNADRLAGVTVDKVAVTGKGKIVGTFGNDVITGSAKADKIYTGAGNDTITAGKGNDTIYINGAGNKTINIANGDGNDVITGASTEGSSTNIVFTKGIEVVDESLSYTKNGTSNDLIITRKYTEQLKDKNNKLLYIDAVTKKQTTEATLTGVSESGTFYEDKKGNIITEKAYNDLTGDKSDYNKVEGSVYSYNNGNVYSTDATKTNEKLTKDYTTTTTVKDFFNPDKTSDVSVNGEKLDNKKLDGLTINGQLNKNNKIYGSDYNDVITGGNKNDVITDLKGNNTFNIGEKGNTDINAGTGDDTYNVKNLTSSVSIVDKNGNDTLNIDNDKLSTNDLRLVFNVDKVKGAYDDLLIADKNNFNRLVSGKQPTGGIEIEDYFTTTAQGESGKIEKINLNKSSIESTITERITEITGKVQAWLSNNNLSSTEDDNMTKAQLKELANLYTGNDTHEISTITGNTKQTITDKFGDADVYNVDKDFDFTKDNLVITDNEGDNDVLNIAQKADDLTILFNIKKTTTEGESAVGDALYVVGKGSTDLSKGIQMSGIDKVKTSDDKGGYTDVKLADTVVSDVQSWLTSANGGKGYDSVADAIQANDSNLADLIAKFAPSQPQA